MSQVPLILMSVLSFFCFLLLWEVAICCQEEPDKKGRMNLDTHLRSPIKPACHKERAKGV